VTSIPIILFGATGRMGRAVRATIAEFPDLTLAVCVARTVEAGGGPSGCAWMTPDELVSGGGGAVPAKGVVIDVSLPEGTARLMDWLDRSPHALVSAPTALGGLEEKRIVALAQHAPVLRAMNLSLGNAVARAMLDSTPHAAKRLFDIDIIEHHHAGKKDAPSGTAIWWAVGLASGPDAIEIGPDLRKPREPGKIRLHSIRAGAAVGTHRALFAGAGETIEVVHTVSDRAVFARGALQAARYLAGKPPGHYTLEQMLEQT
jgi:4-hydroxy-tetrahydrodipicolinate reductase